MAIQLRRGSYEDFDPQKMKPAEVAVVQRDDPISPDGKAVYVAIQPGEVKRIVTDLEVSDLVERSMDDILATKVQVIDSNNNGNIIISFD